MSVWLTIPSARPIEEAEPVLRLWADRGYRIALWRDDCSDSDFKAHGCADLIIEGTYPGYAIAVNSLIARLIECDAAAEWFVAAGDDTEPDPYRFASAIAYECRDHFSDPRVNGWMDGESKSDGSLFGVMQPTGDRWHEGIGGFQNAPIDRVCGSAWYGREYCRRMYQGNGPLFPGYRHMFVDEEAQEVAQRMGVLWQRRDLVQKHRHWGRGPTDQSVIELKPGTIPPHLEKWNTAQHWSESKTLFTMRKANGFPGHEPIA